MSYCKYNNIFGNPREGLHAYRVFDLAVVDVLLTVALAYTISVHFKTHFLETVLTILLLGIFMHWLFCVDTKVARILL